MTQKMSPLRRRMIEDMTVRNLSPATQRSYISAVLKFSRYFGRSPGPVGTGRRPRFPGSPGVDGHFVAGAQSDRMRLALLLQRHARPGAQPGAHSLRARTSQIAGCFERGRGRAVSRSRVEPEEPRSIHDRLCGRAQGLGGREPSGRGH
jgi:hypothetical protein